MSNDFLTTLDKAGILEDVAAMPIAKGTTELEKYLNAIPANLAKKLTVKTYEYRTDTFTLKKTFTATKGNLTEEKIYVKRVFVIPKSSIYGIAELEVSHA
jgi:hypothetical protein